MLKKIVFINLAFVFSNIIMVHCGCKNDPSGVFEINEANIKMIGHFNPNVKGIAFSVSLDDSTLKNIPMASLRTFYNQAIAFSKPDCFDKKILKEKIIEIKITALNTISDEILEGTDVTRSFVSDRLEYESKPNILKTSITENIQYINRQGYAINHHLPDINLYFIHKTYELPAQFKIEVELDNGKIITANSPIFK